MSSGSLLIWLVPKLSSTIVDHVPISGNKETKMFLIFSENWLEVICVDNFENIKYNTVRIVFATFKSVFSMHDLKKDKGRLLTGFGLEIISKSNLPIGSEVSWFSFMLSFVRWFAREKIPYGILSHWLCSMFRACVLMNWAGPPAGNAVNWNRKTEYRLNFNNYDFELFSAIKNRL